MKEPGYDEAARICITHSFALKSPEQYIGKRDITETDLQLLRNLLASYTYDDYDRHIRLCDSIAIADEKVRLYFKLIYFIANLSYGFSDLPGNLRQSRFRRIDIRCPCSHFLHAVLYNCCSIL